MVYRQLAFMTFFDTMPYGSGIIGTVMVSDSLVFVGQKFLVMHEVVVEVQGAESVSWSSSIF